MLAQRFKLEETLGLSRYLGSPLRDYVNLVLENDDAGPRLTVTFSDWCESGEEIQESRLEFSDPVVLMSKVSPQAEALVTELSLRNLAKRGMLARLGQKILKIDDHHGAVSLEDVRNLLPKHILHLSRRFEKGEDGAPKEAIYFAEIVNNKTLSNETAGLIRKTLDAIKHEIAQFVGVYNHVASIESGVFELLNTPENVVVTESNKLIAIKPFGEVDDYDADKLLDELAVIFNATTTENKKKLFAAFFVAALARVCLLNNGDVQLTGLPLIIVTSGEPGAGKTALAATLAAVGDVSENVTLKVQTESEELRKQLAAMALQGSRVFVLDNIPRRSTLTQDVISAAATGKLGVRLLGKNEEVVIMNPLIIATGIDLEFNDEIARRTIKIENTRANENEEVVLFGEVMPRWQAVSLLSNNQAVVRRIAAVLLQKLNHTPLVNVAGARSFISLRIVNGVSKVKELGVAKSETETHFGTQLIRELTRLVLLEADSGVAEIWSAEGLKADEGVIKERLDGGDLCELLTFVEAAYINGDFTPYRRTRLAIDCVKASLSNAIITISFAPNVIIHRLAAYLQEDTAAKGILGELHAINKRDRIAEFVTNYEHLYTAIKKELRSSFKSEAVGGAMKTILRLANSLEDDERITYIQRRDTTHQKCAVVEIVYSVDKFKKYIGEIPVKIKDLKTGNS